MTAYKNFTVKDNNGNVVFEGIGGNANAWAQTHVREYGDLYVHYYGESNVVLHWFVGDVTDVWGYTHESVCHEWAA